MSKIARYALCAFAVAVLPVSAVAEKLSLGEISTYLNSFSTASGVFTQINDDGTISTGTIAIKRPGRLRFEYDPPEDLVVVADGTHVGILDGRSNTGPEAYPLARTPLKIILARQVDLTGAEMVTGHASDGTSTIIRAQDPRHPEYGSIELVFTTGPVALRQWVIQDSTGSRTTLVLGDLVTGTRIDNKAFVIPGIGIDTPDR